MRFVIRWLFTAIALGAAVLLVPGIRVGGDAPLYVAATALVLGLVNAFIRPVLRMLSCPFILITLGLFMLVINAFTLWFSAYVAVTYLRIPFYVDGFLPALAGGIVITVVSWVLNILFPDVEVD